MAADVTRHGRKPRTLVMAWLMRDVDKLFDLNLITQADVNTMKAQLVQLRATMSQLHNTQDDTKSSSKLGQIATANPLLALDDFVHGFGGRGGDDEDIDGDD